jgi:8-oxo-dGTP pyrophosphatase MutT (NUDIX family)
MLVAWELTWGTRRCKYFDTPSGCRSGDACEFLHLRGPTTIDEMEMHRINFLGGKREDNLNETSQQTAAREFCEETNTLITPKQAQTLVNDKSTVSVSIYGSYELYIGCLPESVDTTRLVQLYTFIGAQPPLASAERLMWVPLKSLTDVQWSKSLGYHINVPDSASRHNAFSALPISHLVWSFALLHGKFIKTLVSSGIVFLYFFFITTTTPFCHCYIHAHIILHRWDCEYVVFQPDFPNSGRCSAPRA